MTMTSEKERSCEVQCKIEGDKEVDESGGKIKKINYMGLKWLHLLPSRW